MSMICSIHAAKEDDLQRYNGNADDLFDFFEESEDTIDLDKAWHAIHYLLTGSAWEGDPPKNFEVPPKKWNEMNESFSGCRATTRRTQ